MGTSPQPSYRSSAGLGICKRWTSIVKATTTQDDPNFNILAYDGFFAAHRRPMDLPVRRPAFCPVRNGGSF